MGVGARKEALLSLHLNEEWGDMDVETGRFEHKLYIFSCLPFYLNSFFWGLDSLIFVFLVSSILSQTWKPILFKGRPIHTNLVVL